MAVILTDDRRRGWWWAENDLVDKGWIKEMGPFTWAIYCALLRCSDSKGSAFPSYDYLARVTGVSERQVPRCLGRLLRLNLIEKVKQGGGSKGSNLYRLLPLKADAQKDPVSREDAPEPTKTKKAGGLEPLEPFVFQRAWDAYPRKVGVSRASAVRAWNARIKEGTPAERIALGVEAYASYCHALKTEQKFIKQPATFFGPDQHWLADFTVPEQTDAPRHRGDHGKDKVDLLDYYSQEKII